MTTRTAPRAALFSAVLPGLGQAYLGQVRQARWLIGVDIVLVGSLVLLLTRFRMDLIKAWVSPNALLIFMGLNVVLLAYRAYAVAAAYRTAPGDVTGWAGRMLMLASILILVMPHLAVGFVAWTQYDLIKTVFAPSPPVAIDTTTTSTTSTTSTTMLDPTTSWPQETTTSTSSTTTTLPPTTTTTLPPLWSGMDRLNIVLLGADAGAGRRGIRTDTTIVVSIDPVTGETAMISVPRNLSNIPLPKGMGTWDCNCFPDLLTHLYDAAEKNPSAFPGPNEPWFNAIKGALGELLGIPIHYYAMVTLDGFVGVVDALGGVTIDVPKTIIDTTYPHENGSTVRVEIPAGRHHLDGHLALAYARIRRTSDDFARMHRQRCVLGAVVEQTNPLEIIVNFPKLADAIKRSVTTDIPQDRLVDFVDLIPKMGTDRIASLRIDRSYMVSSPPGRAFYNLDRIKREAHLLITDPDAAREQFGALDTTCDKSFD